MENKIQLAQKIEQELIALNPLMSRMQRYLEWHELKLADLAMDRAILKMQKMIDMFEEFKNL